MEKVEEVCKQIKSILIVIILSLVCFQMVINFIDEGSFIHLDINNYVID